MSAEDRTVHSGPNLTGALERLRHDVRNAETDFSMAVALHECWRPAAYDSELHARMSNSYAGQAFILIRVALRREMLMALMRIWRKSGGASSLHEICTALKNRKVWDELLQSRLERHELRIADSLIARRQGIISLYHSYLTDQPNHPIFVRMKELRDGRLAHSSASNTKPVDQDPGEQEVEQFFSDTSRLVADLLSLVYAEAHDYAGTANVFQHYAKLFWEGSFSERSTQHPRHRPPLSSES
jgi:hypothetical protein